jgi:hypothetical protein
MDHKTRRTAPSMQKEENLNPPKRRQSSANEEAVYDQVPHPQVHSGFNRPVEDEVEPEYANIEAFLMAPGLALKAFYQADYDGRPDRLLCEFLFHTNVSNTELLIKNVEYAEVDSVLGTKVVLQVHDLQKGVLRHILDWNEEDRSNYPELVLEDYERLNYSHIALIFLNYFHIKVPNILTKLSPLDLALCCYDIYHVLHDEDDPPIRHLIVSNCIRDFYHPPPKEIPASSDDPLEQLFKTLNVFKRQPSCKNQGLIWYLKEMEKISPFAGLHFQHQFVEQYCANQQEMKQKHLQERFPGLLIKLARPKMDYRIEQKYEEYASEFVLSGFHIYRRFKDLFRATIVYPELNMSMEDLTSMVAPDLVEVKINRDVGIVYFILNCDNDLAEIQVVMNKKKTSDSHQYYELIRENTLENLEQFIKRNIISPK